ncbi:MAG: glycosyl hydrolase family 65 protein [Sphaerobacter sp.]|nr:glycosyl hydrolase family 65 protein [Sphaerobacter sp.]
MEQPRSHPEATEDAGSPGAERAALRRPFRAIIFDWDGTAVADRREHADALVTLADALLALDVWLVVVTGTHYGNIDRQFCRFVKPELRQRLLVCTNRGSEVFGFDAAGRLEARWQRTATPEEDRALTRIAEAVRDAIRQRTGLEVGIVYDRLNRRKIDLIPLPEWADPPKAQIGALLAAVEARLRAAGWTGGLAEVIHLTADLAAAHGLPDARITSDVKHIEVGLTDKGDAVNWIRAHLLEPQGIPLHDVLVAGDEFGPIGGVSGSDDRLREEAPGAVVVSVGAEPNGVPPGVLHLGGGPARFRELLAEQVWRWRRARGLTPQPPPPWVAALSPVAEPAWRLDEPTYLPAIEHRVESRFTVANGLVGVRGSLDQPTAASRPLTLVAGLFDTPNAPLAVPALVPAPDWLRLRITLDGQPLEIEGANDLRYARTLDLRRGMLLSDWCQRDAAGRTVRVRSLRFASQVERTLAVQMLQLTVDRPVAMRLEVWIEAPHDRLVLERATPDVTVWRTVNTGRRVAMAPFVQLWLGSDPMAPPTFRDGVAAWSWVATPDQPVTLLRTVAIARGERADPVVPARRAIAARARARDAGPEELLARHVQAWAERWEEGDVQIEGDEMAQRGMRYALYHLISAANPADERVSIGARALTGEAYLGHVFWDTEIFVLPYYIFTWPAAARAALMYRYHTLPVARARAQQLGYRGALFPWESADTGEEVTPPFVVNPTGRVIPILSGTLEQHITADVAYAVWQYWQATGDLHFLLNAGAEILLDTARFWASRVTWEEDGYYHIRNVIGPDEYHDGVDDNAFTNVMAAWNLETALEVAALLAQRRPARWAELRQALDLSDAELAHWRTVAARLFPGRIVDGVIEQFAGFFDLEPIDLRAFEPRAAPMDVMLGPERTRRSQVVKQADVVMLLALLWERFPPHVREASFRYYEPRTGHGSSLSPATHALVAARLGDVDLALHYVHETIAIDLDDAMGNAALGVHIAAQGGLWQAVVLGFAGMRLRPFGLAFDPHLPATWRALRFSVGWHGRRLDVDITQDPLTVTLTLRRGRSLMVEVGDLTHRLSHGECWTCHRDGPDGRWKESHYEPVTRARG